MKVRILVFEPFELASDVLYQGEVTRAKNETAVLELLDGIAVDQRRLRHFSCSPRDGRGPLMSRLSDPNLKATGGHVIANMEPMPRDVLGNDVFLIGLVYPA